MSRFIDIGNRTLNLDKLTGFRLGERDGEPILVLSSPLNAVMIRGEHAKAAYDAIREILKPEKLNIPADVVVEAYKSAPKNSSESEEG